MPSWKQRSYLASLILILPLTSYALPAQRETIDGIYRGTLGKEQIVLEMGIEHVPETEGGKHDGNVIVGRYFFRRFGAATRLKGVSLPDGTINLKEDEPYSFSKNEFRLTVRADQAAGSFWEYDVPSEGRSVKQFPVFLTRISKGFDPRLPHVPDSPSASDKAYYELILDSPLRRGPQILVDKQTAYVLQGDPRFPNSLPLLTRFPDRRIMAKLNAELTRELNERRLLDSGCVMGRRFDHDWKEKNSVTFFGRDILSVVRETRRYCGSYESSVEALNFDLQRGKPLDLNLLFRMQRKGAELTRDEQLPNEAAFLPLVDLYVKHAIALEDDCKSVVGRDAYMRGPLGLSVYFRKEGLVLTPLLFGDDRRCADDEIIPYHEIRGLIRSDTPFRSILRLTRAKSRTSPLVYIARSLQLVHEGEFSGQDVIPPRVRYLQTSFKHRLRDFVGNILNEQTLANATRPQIRRSILQRLKSMGIFEGFKEYGPDYTYGHVLDITVDAVPQHPELLAIGLIVDVNWDEDESLYIFQRQETEWRNILAAEVNDYPTVWDAQSSRFNYAISPPAADGSWFLVTSSVNPHKASAWQHVTYTAWATGPDADHPRVLVRQTHTIYLAGSEDESRICRIKATETGFGVWFPVGFSLAEERYSDEYRVSNGTAKRVSVRCRTRNIMGRPVACSLQP